MNIEFLFPNFFGISDCDLDLDHYKKYAYDRETEHQGGLKISNIGGFQSYSLFLDEDDLKPLIDRIMQESYSLANQLGVKNKLQLANMWCNINRRDNFNMPHIHTGFISGIFYAKTGENCGELRIKNPSQIHPIFMGGLDFDKLHPAIANEWFFEPKDNQMFLFPAYLEHYVMQNKTDEDRISYAFNINAI